MRRSAALARQLHPDALAHQPRIFSPLVGIQPGRHAEPREIRLEIRSRADEGGLTTHYARRASDRKYTGLQRQVRRDDQASTG